MNTQRRIEKEGWNRGEEQGRREVKVDCVREIEGREEGRKRRMCIREKRKGGKGWERQRKLGKEHEVRKKDLRRGRSEGKNGGKEKLTERREEVERKGKLRKV